MQQGNGFPGKGAQREEWSPEKDAWAVPRGIGHLRPFLRERMVIRVTNFSRTAAPAAWVAALNGHSCKEFAQL